MSSSIPRLRARLLQDLAARRARNARYSLRAFARDLDVDHSTLSQLLRGKRPATERAVRLLGERLKLEAPLIEAYVALELCAGGQHASSAEVARVAQDLGRVMGDPLHFELFDAVRRGDAPAGARPFAARLGTSVDALNVALHRLLRLDLVVLRGPTWATTVRGASIHDREQFVDHVMNELATAASHRTPDEERAHG